MNIIAFLCIAVPTLILVGAFGFVIDGEYGAGLATAGMAVLTGGALLFVNNMLVANLDREWVVTDTTPIVSLANASEIHGRGGLMSSRVDEKNVYRYVTRAADGSYTFGEIDAEGIRIVDDAAAGEGRIDDEACYYRKPATKKKSEEPDFGLTQFGDGPFTACGTRLTVHIPEGSILNEFLIDPSN